MVTQVTSANFSTATLTALATPTVSSITVTDNTYTATGANAVALSGGYVKIVGNNFVSGATVYIDSTPATSVTFVNSTQLNAQVPALASNTYVVYIINPDGSVAIRVNGINYSSTPTWISSGSQSGLSGTVSIQLVATSDSTIVYSLASGSSLPTGLTLSSSGLLSGTVTGSGTVVYNFSVVATDLETQQSTQAFTISISFNDTYFKNVSLLLNGETSVTPFISDASTNSFGLTINGDTKPNKFSPYYGDGYYGVSFDGSVDNLVFGTSYLPTAAGVAFTLEFWMYFTRPTSSVTSIISSGNMELNIDTATPGQMRFDLPTGSTNVMNSGSTVLTPNRWTHIAITRTTGNAYTMYFDGVIVGTGSSATAISTLTTFGYRSSSRYQGYISNLRTVNSLVYTGAFTPSTTPLTAIANTVLLTCQSNRFVDKSLSPITITTSGSPTISSAIPFTANSNYSTYGSGYFNGSSDYITIPNNTNLQFGTGDFTVECWIFATVVGSAQKCIISKGTNTTGWEIRIGGAVSGGLDISYSSTAVTNSTVVTLNTWHHVALTRSGTSVKVFLDGVVVGSDTTATDFSQTDNLKIGDSRTGSQTFSGYISNVRILKGTALYTAAFTPPTQPLTAIANTSLLTLQYNGGANNSGIIDNSNFNNIITRNGNATQGSFSPYSVTGWSTYFDGTANYLTTGGTTIGTGPVTFEFWLYFTGTDSTRYDLIQGDTSNWLLYRASSNILQWYTNNAKISVSGFTLAAYGNRWLHIAVCRSGTTTKLFIDGTQAGADFTSDTSNYTTPSMTIGKNAGAAYYMNGYISNFRIVTTALYTTSFTKPTEPLTAISGTQILTCQSNRFIDNSASNLAVTTTGTPSIQAFSPFGSISEATPTSYSNYFDGTGDYLTTPTNVAFSPGTADFTLETWIYPTTAAGSSNIFFAHYSSGISFYRNTGGKLEMAQDGVAALATSTNNITVNTWSHVVACRSETSLKLFINGSQEASVTNSTNLVGSGTVSIGASSTPASNYFTGNISNMRFVKGQALYTSTFTPSTTQLTTTSQGATASNVSLLTCQSTTMIDNSANRFTLTATGDVKPRQFNPFGYTAQSAASYTPSLHGGSAYFDGTGDYLNIPTTTNFGFSNGDFTIEFWAYPTVNARQDWVDITDGTNRVLVYYSGSAITFYSVPSNAAAITGPAMVLNAWVHIALAKNSGSSRLFVNGVQVGSTYATNQNYFTTSPITIGKDSAGSTYVTGYISDIRIIKGTGLYTSNFVPPTQTLTNYSTTYPASLLLNMNNGGIVDQHSSNVLETVGNAQLSTSVKKYNNASIYFDGSTSKLTIPASPQWIFGTGDFTVEFWMNTADTAAGLITPATTGAGYWALLIASSTLYWQNAYNSSNLKTASLSGYLNNTWVHIAVVRYSGNLYFYFNGTAQGSATADSTNYSGVTNTLTIGYDSQNNGYYSGYIDDLRITKGHARYTANFSAPISTLQTF